MHHLHLCKHLFVLQFCPSVSAVRDSGTGRGWPRQDPGRIGCEPMASADLRERRCDNDGGLDPWVAGARQRRADGGGAVAWMRDLPGSELQISAKKTVADERKRKLGTFSDAAFDVILSRRALSSLEPTAWQERWANAWQTSGSPPVKLGSLHPRADAFRVDGMNPGCCLSLVIEPTRCISSPVAGTQRRDDQPSWLYRALAGDTAGHFPDLV